MSVITRQPSGSASNAGRNSSSATTVCSRSSAATSRSCPADRPVLSSTTSAPSLPAATWASIAARRLRQSTPTRTRGPTPDAANPLATASVWRSSSAKVTEPSSSTIAVRSG